MSKEDAGEDDDGGDGVATSVLEIPKGEDVHEFMFRMGLTDGLPVIPCTDAKLRWMLSGTALSPSFVLGKMPPIMATCTVANVATNAVMAGCEPRHLRVVIAAVRAALDPQFSLHGVHATTMGATPLIVVNGKRLIESASLNCKHGALGSGQDNRSNATIGRALKLVLQNCGRAKLGGTESTTIGGPRKFTLCLAENVQALERRSPPWKQFRGDGNDVVTVKSVASGVDQLVDFKCTREMFVEMMAEKIVNLYNCLPVKLMEVTVVVSPEHYEMLHDSGVKSKAQLQRILYHAANARVARSIPLAVRFLLHNKAGILVTEVAVVVGHLLRAVLWILNVLAPVQGQRPANRIFVAAAAATLIFGCFRRTHAVGILAFCALVQCSGLLSRAARKLAALASKTESEASIHIIVSGSRAGKFSCVLPGFGTATNGKMKISRAVTRTVDPAPPRMDTTARNLAQAMARAVLPRSIVDPRGSCEMGHFQQAKRTGSLPRTIGLMDISKPGGSWFFDKLEALFKSAGVSVVRRYCKPTFARPCPEELRKRIITECDAVVLALAD